MIVEGTVVDSVAAALVELSDVHNFTAVVLEIGDAFILLHHTTWGVTSKMFTGHSAKKNDLDLSVLMLMILCTQHTRKVFCHPYTLIVQLSGVFHPHAKCAFHLCHIPGVDQRFYQAL